MSSVVFFGHACFAVETADQQILIDPWLTGNPEMARIPEEVHPNLILVTHNHVDHVGDAIELSKKFGAPIVATPSNARHYMAEGASVTLLHLGGRAKYPWGSVKSVPAFHDSPLSIGATWRVDLGAASGFVVEAGGKTIYHAGDTCLFGDMRLWAPVDFALLPIDGVMTMEPKDAIRAAGFLEAEMVIPMHWREEDPDAFVAAAVEAGFRAKRLQPFERVAWGDSAASRQSA